MKRTPRYRYILFVFSIAALASEKALAQRAVPEDRISLSRDAQPPVSTGNGVTTAQPAIAPVSGGGITPLAPLATGQQGWDGGGGNGLWSNNNNWGNNVQPAYGTLFFDDTNNGQTTMTDDNITAMNQLN